MIVITLAAALGIAWPSASRIPVGKASLYVRDIGKGRPVIVLHGGPDFDQSYLVPDLDRWADAFRVIYYAQRGALSPPIQARAEETPGLCDPDGGEAAFRSQGKEGIVARAVEDRLMQDTWVRADYDILPALRDLRIPTLVLYGDHDFIPGEIARHVAQAVRHAALVTLKDCGHFAHLECAGEVRRAVDSFLQSTRSPGSRTEYTPGAPGPLVSATARPNIRPQAT